jgi:hypothetical protein
MIEIVAAFPDSWNLARKKVRERGMYRLERSRGGRGGGGGARVKNVFVSSLYQDGFVMMPRPFKREKKPANAANRDDTNEHHLSHPVEKTPSARHVMESQGQGDTSLETTDKGGSSGLPRRHNMVYS